MDIKTWLLKGLSSIKPIFGCRRLYFGKSCFVVKFQVKGKYVTILQIKKVSTKHRSKRRQINRRYRFLIRSNMKNFSRICPKPKTGPFCDIEKVIPNDKPSGTYVTQGTSTPNVLLQNKETQTETKTGKSRAINCSTQTKIILRKTSAQQTIACPRYNLGGYKEKPFTLIPPILKDCVYSTTSLTQTEFQTFTTGVQCKLRTYSGGTQTDDISVNSLSSQVGCGCFSQPNKTLPETNAPSFELIDLTVFCYMVAQLGELVVDQNHILRNNSKILNQLKISSKLRKLIILGKCRRKSSAKMPSKTFIKTQETFKSSKSTQTDEQLEIRKFNKVSQTTGDLKKSRTLLSFLKKQISNGHFIRKLSCSNGRHR